MEAHDGMRSVLIGYDGSPAAGQALRWAAEEARLRGLALTVCHVWHWPYPVSAVCSWWDPAALPGPDRVPFIEPQAIRHEAIARFERAVAPWRAGRPEVTIETKFVLDAPRRVLVSASHGAALLVVGVRGIGSLPPMLLGPVPQVALHEARCPVAVVPAPQPGR